MLVRPFFTEWAQLLEAHLRDATAPAPDRIADRAFRRRLGAAAARRRLADGVALGLSAANGIGAALDETEQAAPEALDASDLSLDISSDVDAALIDAFLHDSPPQAAEVTQSLQGWIADPAQSELLRNAKRAAHTLKGSANILGIRGVAKLAHRLEDILEICEADSAPPVVPARPGAHVRRRLPRADGGRGRGRRLRARQRARRHRTTRCGAQQRRVGHRASARARRCPSATAAPPESSPGRFARAARGEAKATTRVPTELLDNLVRMVGEITIKIGELDQELKSAAGHSRQLVEHDRAIQKRLFELEHSVDIRGVAARHKLHAVQTSIPTSTRWRWTSTTKCSR